MDAQVVNEGRHQGGRAPYGYIVIDSGTHPNPRKAAEGYRLRVLAIDDASADVVRRIFADYLDGAGDRAIAARLNRDGILCPSARRPDQNRHRLADGSQPSTIRSILENPRYTGYAFFGRWFKQEMLLDPDDVASGHVVRFRKSPRERVVRSRNPAHPAIVSVQEFTETQLIRRARANGGLEGQARLERTVERATPNRPYLLRSLIRCDLCGRKMFAAPIRAGVYYRCLARTIAPGSPALANHPKTMNLREDHVIGPLNAWIAVCFDDQNRESTVAALLGAQHASADELRGELVRQRLSDAESRLRRHSKAIEAGVDPVALAEAMNAAQADRAAALAELKGIAKGPRLTASDVDRLIDSLGDIAEVLRDGDPEDQAALYKALRLQMRYFHFDHAVRVKAEPRVTSVRVRGGT
ncbi:recombinase family protein [Antrihabitans sp. YC2-6]|uniref:recombinase family protein n=1 Tax=Antrihabitans sp. YC2-6 TaxID=2799498 RepID=UPI001F3EFD25|nr:recombinase family protein [Antrihabitans sp. YC2-6]